MALAQQLFPRGVDAARQTMSAVEATRELLARAEVIFNASVVTQRGIRARADILIREDGDWHLVNVTSTTLDERKASKVGHQLAPDLAWCVAAFREAGVRVIRCSLLCLNRSFIRDGAIQPGELFVSLNLTEGTMHEVPAVQEQMTRALADLQDADHPSVCDCHRTTRSNRCPLFSRFHPEIPDHGTVYNISGITRTRLLPALDRGILALEDWPDDLPLSPKMARQVRVARSQQPIIDEAEIISFLQEMRFPLWFLDYESFQQPIPLWDGYRPNQQIPFQYSLHRMDEDLQITHTGYLCDDRAVEPVPALLAQLQRELGPEGTVVSWNQRFERDRNADMAELHPKYGAFLRSVNERMVDLADIVHNGWWQDPAFEGRWSLKAVLPTVAPELDYGRLEIGDGSTASERWMQAMIDPYEAIDAEARAATMEALRTYCHQDTLAMVRIWEHAWDLVTRASGGAASYD